MSNKLTFINSLKKFESNYQLFFVLGIGIISIIVFYFLFNAKILHFFPNYLNDQISYIQVARHLVDYGLFISPSNFPGTGTLVYPELLLTENSRLYMPGYFIFLAGFYKLFGVNSFTSILPNISSYLLSIYLIYYLAKKFYDKQVAFLSCIFFMFFPLNIQYTLSAMSEMPLVFTSLLTFTILTKTPKKWQIFIAPWLLILPFLFRQTGLFLLIPFLAFIYDQRKYKIWQLLLTGLSSIIILGLIYYWQKKSGLYSLNLIKMLTQGHISYYNALFTPPNIASHFDLLILLFKHIKENIVLATYSLLNNTYNQVGVISVIEMMTFTIISFFSGLYYIKLKKLWFPLACPMFTLVLLAICFGLYNGHINTVMRIILLTMPFIFIEGSNFLVKLKMNYEFTFSDYLSSILRTKTFCFNKNHLLYFYLFINLIILSLTAINLRHYEKLSFNNNRFIESVHPVQNMLLVAPEDIFIEYNYKHYPQLTSFLPENKQTLFLLNKKYPIGTIIIPSTNLGNNFTIKDINAIGLSFSTEMEYNCIKYTIFKKPTNQNFKTLTTK